MERLSGKIAIVTGAAQGIGAAIATRFAAEGATVFACDINRAQTGSSKTGIHQRHLDVSDIDGWRALVGEILDSRRRIDILVNNAGIVLDYAQIIETDLENYERVVAVNQTGTFLGMQAVLPSMKSARAGSIVNISSIWGSVGAAGAAAYHAAKGAVRNMTKNAAISYAADGVRVNSVHPGLIWTPLIEAQSDEMNKAIIAVTPMGRMGTPDEVAAACLFLASDESSFVTGAELNVDGGYLAQ